MSTRRLVEPFTSDFVVGPFPNDVAPRRPGVYLRNVLGFWGFARYERGVWYTVHFSSSLAGATRTRSSYPPRRPTSGRVEWFGLSERGKGKHEHWRGLPAERDRFFVLVAQRMAEKARGEGR